MHMLGWLRRVTLPPGLTVVSICASVRAATIAVLSLPTVVEIANTGFKEGPEIFDLRAPRYLVIVIHAHPAVWHRIHSDSIVKTKFT